MKKCCVIVLSLAVILGICAIALVVCSILYGHKRLPIAHTFGNWFLVCIGTCFGVLSVIVPSFLVYRGAWVIAILIFSLGVMFVVCGILGLHRR